MATAVASAWSTTSPLPCRTSTTNGDMQIQAVKEMLTRSDSGSILLRNVLGLNGVDSSTVATITNSTICTSMTQAVDSALGVTPSTRAYLVIRAGPRYVAMEPDGPDQFFVYADTTYTVRNIIHR